MGNKKIKGNRIADVAKLAGVSPATVSRVFNKHPYVKDDVKEKVIKAARSLNYAPKSTRAKNAFGIMVRGNLSMILGAYETQLISGISREFFKHGYNTEITTDLQVSLFHSNTFQALIVLTSGVDRSVVELGIPMVLVNKPFKGVASVVTDHFQGIELAIEHLIENGHQKIAFISGETHSWGTKERIRGYKETLKKHDIEYNEKLHKVAIKHDVARATEEIMNEEPTAIVLSGEGRAQCLSHALSTLGKSIPEDVSIITFEDGNVTPYLTPPHTTISQNIEVFAKEIADLAIKVSKKDDVIKNVVLENKLIVRNTVKDLTTK